MNVRLFRLIALPTVMSGASAVVVTGTAHAQATAAPAASAAPAAPAPGQPSGQVAAPAQPAPGSPQVPGYPPQPPGYPQAGNGQPYGQPTYGQQGPSGYGGYPQPAAYYGGGYMPAPPGYHTHDGFYLRLQAGFGGGSWNVDLPMRVGDLGETLAAGKDKVSGSLFGFQLGVGGAISRHVIMFGELFYNTLPEPKVTSAGQELSSSGTSFNEVGVGPGIAYYFDNNIYISGSLRFFHLTKSFDDTTDDTNLSKWGSGLSLGVGKEWWASDDWGIGIGLTGFVGQAKDSVFTSHNWQGASLLLAFSATYN